MSVPQITQVANGRVEITTDRMILRTATQQDVASLHEAFSDPEVMRYW
jgi:RimJ/RimL family protein N-acetyltransferase